MTTKIDSKLIIWDDWTDICTSTACCPKCKTSLTFRQTGDPLPQEIIPSLVKIMHIENSYEAYYRYFSEFNVLVNVEMEKEN